MPPQQVGEEGQADYAEEKLTFSNEGLMVHIPLGSGVGCRTQFIDTHIGIGVINDGCESHQGIIGKAVKREFELYSGFYG